MVVINDDKGALRQLIVEAGRTVRAAMKSWAQTGRLCVLLAVAAAAAALIMIPIMINR
jgi:pyrimidine operon attenuation protein/uracil phosphoribosyltransferase